jgi:hypothetical protein
MTGIDSGTPVPAAGIRTETNHEVILDGASGASDSPRSDPRNREEIWMSAMPNPAQSEFSPGSLPVKPPIETPAVRLADLKNERFPSGRPLLGKRALLALARFLITFCIGVGAALAWQSYGDEARGMIANSYPQLGWLALRPAPTAQNAPDAIALAAPAAPSPDQQLNAMSLDAVRQSVDRIATS